MLGLFGRVSVVCVLGAGLAACASNSSLMTPSPGAGQYKVGQPYEVGGQWYSPREQTDYDETGIASWYGPSFYGHRTADGEIFNANDMTAAHPTLPMPVYVRVTDLDNGRSAILRVNDRGPYANNRIIDVSEHAAEVLGFKRAGTAHVRVQYLGRADSGAPAPENGDNETAVAANTPGQAAPDADVADTAADAAEATRTAALNAASAGASVAADAAPVAVTPAIPLAAPDSQPSSDDETTADQSGPAADNAGNSESPAGQAAAQVPDDPPSPVVAQADLPPPAAQWHAPAPPDPPAAKSAAAPKPASAGTGHGQIFVQAGAFSSLANADRLIAMLASVGSFFISPVEKAGEELYRVRLGPFDDLGAANAALARLTGLGNSSARIVTDP